MITLTGNEGSAYIANLLDMEILLKEHFYVHVRVHVSQTLKEWFVHASLSHLSICEIWYNRLDLQ